MDCENLFGLGALFTSPRRTQARTHFAEFLNIAQHQPSILIRDTARCLDMVVQYKQRTLLETFMLSHFRYLCAANTAYTCGPKIFGQFCPINSDCLHSQMILNRSSLSNEYIHWSCPMRHLSIFISAQKRKWRF